MTEINEEKRDMMKSLDKLNFPEKTMKKLYAIKDVKQGFISIFISVNNAIAVRGFAAEAKRPESSLYQNPEDYELWSMGEMCFENGEITSEPKFICAATSFKE